MQYWLCRRSHINIIKWLDFYSKAHDIMKSEKNDVILSKLDVNVKTWTVVAGSVSFFKLA